MFLASSGSSFRIPFKHREFERFLVMSFLIGKELQKELSSLDAFIDFL